MGFELSKLRFRFVILDYSLSLLVPRKNRKAFGIRALTDDGAAAAVDVTQPYSVKIPVSDRHILIETGHIGRQTNGSLTVIDGESIVYTSVCLADAPSEPSDFFPLSVHYQECFSAAGWTSGGFFKREGRAKDHEAIVKHLSVEEIAGIKEAFQLMDTDNKGKVSLDQLRNGIQELG